MALTEEQMERMRINRERAMEIKRRRKAERDAADDEAAKVATNRATERWETEGKGPLEENVLGQSAAMVAKVAEEDNSTVRRDREDAGVAGKDSTWAEEDEEGGDVELEPFEVDASPFVTKSEAAKIYCLPEGTLAVCSYVERANPRRGSWAPMKLYRRSEIRRRARERYGGMEGLRAEREGRERRRFERDITTAGDVFKRKKTG